jgi:ATP-binding cassette subfamily B protein
MRAVPVKTVALLMLAVLGGILPVATAWLTKLVLDRLAAPAAVDSSDLVALGLGLAAVGAVMATLGHVTRYLDAEFSRAVAFLSQQRLYESINRLTGLGQLENPRFHDRLQLAIHAGREGPRQLIHGLGGTVQGVTMTAGFLGTLFVLNPWMLAIVLAAAVPTLRVELTLSRRRASMATRLGRAGRREIFFGSLLTRLDAAKETRLFGLGDFFRERMFREVRATNAAHRQVDRRALVAHGLLALLGAGVTGLGVVWAIRAAAGGALSVGDVSVFVAAVSGVQLGTSSVAGRVGTIHNALLLFDHYQAIVQTEPDLPAPARPLPVRPLGAGIELRDVWFRYSPDHPWVLRGVNLTVHGGRSLGLVGLNGSGKSTIVKLLCRFYDPTRGAVLWDGVDLREMSVEQLRSRIGAIFQDFMEYELTAWENIGVGDLAAFGEPDRIVDAARQADVHDTVMVLPLRYDTMLSRIFTSHSERDDPATGVALSGGQWQRIALARALLRSGRDLLILDEPSAGLDAAAEYRIHERLRRYHRGRTSLLISHRLNAVREADSIAVLSDGVIVERGGHADLMAAHGAYAELFALQSSGYQSPVAAEQTAASR